MNNYHKLPRLFLKFGLETGQVIEIQNSQNHYISNVLRLRAGQTLRVFNEQDGEYIAEIIAQTKKMSSLKIKNLLHKLQVEQGPIIAFSLIKKQRQDFLIEKCTELGVHGFQPILTDHCEVRKVNEEKLELQAIEAAEQCERLTVPKVYPVQRLETFITTEKHTVFYCLERGKAPFISAALNQTTDSDIFLIGPEGGFSEKEKHLLEKKSNAVAVNLGRYILRAETAAIMCAMTWAHKNQA